MDLNQGEILGGKFRIERVLGRGGMGVVVAATHLQLGELVALKFLLPEALQNPEAVQRFAREARAAVRIKSEHVARVSDVGMLDNGAPYMVMEYLNGIDLSAWLTTRGPLPIEQAVEFVLQACEALAEAHTLGIVHRDLKPANLFVIERPDGALAVKVLDFGISKMSAFGSFDAGMTKTSTAMGSPLYMSPEQMQSAKDVDARGDLWSLGVVLYELVSGHTPFPGETMTELVLKVVTSPPVPLRSVSPGVPPALEAIVLKCLEKDRAQRFQTVGQLAVALFDFAPRRSKTSVERISGMMQRAGMSASALHLPPSSDHVIIQPAGAAPQTMASWGKTQPPPKGRRGLVLVASAFIAAPILAIGGFALLRSGQRSTKSAALAQSSVPTAQLESVPLAAPKIAPPLTALTSEPALSASAAPSATIPTQPNSRVKKPPRALSAPTATPRANLPKASAPVPEATATATPHVAASPLKMTIQ